MCLLVHFPVNIHVLYRHITGSIMMEVDVHGGFNLSLIEAASTYVVEDTSIKRVDASLVAAEPSVLRLHKLVFCCFRFLPTTMQNAKKEIRTGATGGPIGQYF